MTEKHARVYSHISNRVKQTGERKVVFRGVLDNPYRIHWPSVPVNVQNSILALTISMLNGVADYRNAHRKETRKRKRTPDLLSVQKKKRKVDGEIDASVDLVPSNEPSDNIKDLVSAQSSTNTQPPQHEQPVILKHITCGINQVMKRLELQIQAVRRTVVIKPNGSVAEMSHSPSSLKTILVCRADVNPPTLVDYLPNLVAAYNSARPSDVIKLVSLATGAEASLAQAMGVRRAAVIGFDNTTPELTNLTCLMDSVATVAAAWLIPKASMSQLVPTHIKQVRTSAPKDMKAAKERRLQGKALAKQRKQSSGKPQKGNT